jgi:hypothetical protein
MGGDRIGRPPNPFHFLRLYSRKCTTQKNSSPLLDFDEFATGIEVKKELTGIIGIRIKLDLALRFYRSP